MAAPLRYGGETRGLLLLVNDEVYDESHFRLFNAIAKQVTLALNNSDLYEIQANYALHLEDMVAERTVELQSAQQMLVRSEKLASIGRLSASIAHEINNPLFPLKINLEDMLEDIEDGQAIRTEDVQRTLESVERIRRIVNRLLEFTGKRQSEGADAQPLDLNNVLQSILTLNTKFFEQEGLSIETTLTPLPQIHGNKDQLEQVFMNLVLNAKAAMDSGGILRVSTSHDETHVMVKMVDDGHGIPEDMVENIFEPFVSTRPDGTGLGLFISFGIVQNHNGQILVDSTVDAGTTFTIKLPISSSPEPTPPLN
jgi:two-component system NtrC family sensor kinase